MLVSPLQARGGIVHGFICGALFVDLDFHKTDLAGGHPRHVLDAALDALERERLPRPGFATATGRGLALVWLHRPVPRQALPRWRACQEVLGDALRHLGADRLASDAARVLRLVGTRNSRSGARVEALTSAGEAWDFEPLADEILPLARARVAALRLERAGRRAAGEGTARPARFLTEAGLWELRLAELQRFAELQCLLEHRRLGVLPEGERDLWLLLAGTATSYLVLAPLVGREVCGREVCALARQVTAGAWDDREVLARTGAVVRRAGQAARGERVGHEGRLVDPRYHFRTATVVDLLGISEGEMRACGFRHLVTPEIRREHHRLGEERRRRAGGAQPRGSYEARSLARLRPWEAEGVSRATWHRRRELVPAS